MILLGACPIINQLNLAMLFVEPTKHGRGQGEADLIKNQIENFNWKVWLFCLGQVAQLIRASSGYAKVVGLIPDQGTCKNQPMDA